jgi:hypothetical protein
VNLQVQVSQDQRPEPRVVELIPGLPLVKLVNRGLRVHHDPFAPADGLRAFAIRSTMTNWSAGRAWATSGE